MSEIRVLIVEDEPLIAADISMILDDNNYKIAGIAHDSIKALDYLNIRHPDLVLLDIALDGKMDGIEIAKVINTKYKIPFIYLTSFSDKHTLDRAKHTLPYGYIVKPFKEKDLFTSIEMAMFRHAQEQKGSLPELNAINSKMSIVLTNKEYEVLSELCEGLTNKSIAENLHVSINTIKTHIKNILSKLDVPNRSSAIAKIKAI